MQTLQQAAELGQEGVPEGTEMFNICCPLLPSSTHHSQCSVNTPRISGLGSSALL